MIEPKLTLESYAILDEISRITNIAVAKAQEESRRLGVPNVYFINGYTYYELPDGKLSLEDPYPLHEKSTIATDNLKSGD